MIVFLFLLTAFQATETVPIDHTGALSLEISVPESWGVAIRPRDQYAFHRDIVIAMNNQGDDSLCVSALVKNEGGGRRSITDGPEAIAADLVPGTVYLDVSVIVGGPAPINVPYAWAAEDQWNVQIAGIMEHKMVDTAGYRLVAYTAHFFHWGLHWEARICARQPFAQRDLDLALTALKTLRLPNTPVLDARQAIEVALPYVPEDMRKEIIESNEKCGCCTGYNVVGTKSASGFRVVLDLLEEPLSNRVRKSVSFEVDRAGGVARVAK